MAPRMTAAESSNSRAMVPWLGAALLLAVVNLAIVLVERQALMAEQSVLLIGLCGTIAAAGLASSRCNRDDEMTLREDRARPTAEELVGHSTEVGSASYVQGMGRWSSSMLELLEHAISVTDPATPAHQALVAAAADARDLHDLLDVESVDALTINDKAKLHALGSLWETGQTRLERLAAEADPPWHRRWSARHVVERRLRHGREVPHPLVLPYSR